MFKAIFHEIKEHSTIIIHRHNQPDGDAIGSQIGLKKIISHNFPDKKVYAVGDDPGFFSFVKGAVMDVISDSIYDNALAVILDCGSASLINDSRYTLAHRTARIDHHIFSEKIADVEAIDSTFESCCGMITQLAIDCGLKISRDAAEALYTGMLTDSGRFRYDSTTSRTFLLASKLMESEIDTNEIFKNLYSDDYEKKKLKAQFVLKIKFTENRVAYIYTSKEEVKELNMTEFSASRGMVGTMSDIKGTDIWVNFTESDNGILCEIRSNSENINPIAVKYGGGGHAKASGATVPDYETAMAMLSDLDKMIGDRK